MKLDSISHFSICDNSFKGKKEILKFSLIGAGIKFTILYNWISIGISNNLFLNWFSNNSWQILLNVLKKGYWDIITNAFGI